MAVTATPYGLALQSLLSGGLTFASGTFKVALFTSSYTPNYDSDQYYGALTGEVSASGTGYSAGGATLAGIGVSYDSTNHRAYVTANPVTFSGVTLTARYAVVYKATGSAATSPLISYVDFGGNQTYSTEDVQISFTNYLLRLNVLVASN